MSEHFPQEWLDWIQTNKKLGCDPQEMVSILLKNGFPIELIRQQLDGIQISDEESILADQYILANTMDRLHYWLRDDWLYLPFAERLPHEDIEIYTIEDYLTEEECDHLIAVIKGRLRPSGITRPHPDESFRTSSSCYLGEFDSPLVQEVDARICHTLGLHLNYSEFMQGQYYEVNQQFKPHPDYFDDLDYADHCYPQGQRTWTFMVYLNEPDAGGETDFVETDIKVQPKKGMAVIWNNLDQSGVRNHKALHQGLPVEKGEKVILTKWFRQFSRQQATIKEPGEFVRPLTPAGWGKFKMPQGLFERLKRYLIQHRSDADVEFVPGGFIQSQSEDHGSELLNLPDEFKIEILQELKPLLEEWAGISLEPVTVYGIRTYLEGSSLITHRDRVETHVASVIMNIDQKVEEPWLLYIEDHHYRPCQIEMMPGEMLFYEGARLAHGRLTPLKGESFSNVFVHYKAP